MSSHQFPTSKRNTAAAAVGNKAACFLLVLMLGWTRRTECRRPFTNHHRLLTPPAAAWGTWPTERIQYNACLVHQLRGGAAAAADDSDDDEEDEDYASEDDEQEEYDSDDEQEEEYDDEEEEEETRAASKSAASTAVKPKDTNYVDPWFPSPMMGIYSTIGLMMLSKRTDLFSPTVVKTARFAFIAYVIVLQLFLVYVRVQAKAANDRTPIQLSNPLSGLLAQQMGGDGGGGMMKSLASSFLASSSTVLEYDLSQARNMQGGILFNLFFMWLLHFKMQQVQPLILTTVNGLINLFYSPLFQVYVLGRNLERPFKTQAAVMAETQAEQEQEEAAASQTEAPQEESSGSSSTRTAAKASSSAKAKAEAKKQKKKKVVEEEEEEEDAQESAEKEENDEETDHASDDEDDAGEENDNDDESDDESDNDEEEG